MNTSRLFAVAAMGALTILSFACKKDPLPATQPSGFQGTDPNQPGYGQPTTGYGQPTTGYGQPTTGQPTTGYGTPAGTTTPPPAGTTPTGQPDPMGGLGAVVGGLLGGLGGMTGGAGGNTATDPISIGIQSNASQNAKGMTKVGQAIRLTLQQGQTQESQVNVPAGKCTTLVAASMLGVLEVSIQATLPAPMQQQVFGQNDPGPNPMPVVGANEKCFTIPGMPGMAIPVRVAVTMKQGSGQIGIQVYQK